VATKILSMDNWIKRKEFDTMFSPIIQNGTDIWAIHRLKELPVEIINMAIRLSTLDFIKYVKLTDDSIAASSEIAVTRVKNPITTPDHLSATGITILFEPKYKYINFYEINSTIRGCGSKMVEAVFTGFPMDWQATVVMDWSEGFWDKMKKKHSTIDWMM
jgi:hypothetical protein